jgi:hypothetical protein
MSGAYAAEKLRFLPMSVASILFADDALHNVTIPFKAGHICSFGDGAYIVMLAAGDDELQGITDLRWWGK